MIAVLQKLFSRRPPAPAATTEKTWPNGDGVLSAEEMAEMTLFGYTVPQLRSMLRFAEDHGWHEEPEITLEITPLKGRYCPHCTRSLIECHLAFFAIVPMCRADLDQFMTNGDMQICAKLMQPD